MMQSLQYRKHALSNKNNQLEILAGERFKQTQLLTFREKLLNLDVYPLKPKELEIFQINLGYLCNQTCKHCHVDAGPDRKEIMQRETLELCLEILRKYRITTVDLTGGAPEMNPHFRWFVEKARSISPLEIIVRSNLTVILSHRKYYDLPDFFRQHKVRVVSSLPFYNADRTNRQRGKGVFHKSIEALQRLNALGYGRQKDAQNTTAKQKREYSKDKEVPLQLDLVYNPSGAFLPGNQKELEADFRKELKENFSVEFNHLLTISNLPISRFLDFLLESQNYEEYMSKLVTSFNPKTLGSLMCRNTISIDYQGYMYDCDFNQMLGITLDKQGSHHIRDFDLERLQDREIAVNQHCYACTAGSGSSCQGAIV